MNLLFLTNIPTPYRTTFYNELNSQLQGKGYNLLVLYCAITEPNRNWKFEPKEQDYNYKILKGFHLGFRDFYPHFNVSILREIKLFNPDILVIAGSWNTPTMMLAAIGSQIHRNKMAFWSEGHLDSTIRKTGPVNLLRKAIYRQFGFFCVPNKKSKDFIQDYLGIKSHFIYLPNVVDGDFYMNAPTLGKEELRKKYMFPTNKKLLLQISQLEDRKGVVELVSAYASFKQSHPSSRIIIGIAGTGTYNNKLSELIKSYNVQDGVILLGHKSTQELKELYYASDGFILCSKRDPNPLAPIEASFCGLPLILSEKIGNISELMMEGRNGLILHQVSVEDISQSLDRFDNLTMAELQAMGSGALVNAKERFSLKNICEHFLKDILKVFYHGTVVLN